MPIRMNMVEMAKQMKRRCEWCGSDPLYVAYHDNEWGVPVHDDCRLFEKLVLEGAQAGLSWLTILRKRENYRRAFHGFDPNIIAAYSNADIQRLLQDAGIVRNRLKIESAIHNARKSVGNQTGAWIIQFVPLALYGKRPSTERMDINERTAGAN